MVRVTFGILPAIKMVAPNSPIARQKAKILPVKMPFQASGTAQIYLQKGEPVFDFGSIGDFLY